MSSHEAYAISAVDIPAASDVSAVAYQFTRGYAVDAGGVGYAGSLLRKTLGLPLSMRESVHIILGLGAGLSPAEYASR